MGKNSVALEKKMSATEVASFLENVIASLKEGKIVLQQGVQVVVLKPGDFITVEVEASQKMEKGKLSIDLKWKRNDELPAEEDIIVSSTEQPEPKSESEPEEEIQAKAQETKKKRSPKGKKKPRKKTKR
jgi:amphi-Trp domain-containing protein